MLFVTKTDNHISCSSYVTTVGNSTVFNDFGVINDTMVGIRAKLIGTGGSADAFCFTICTEKQQSTGPISAAIKSFYQAAINS